MRTRNRPSALSVFLSRANEHARREGYAEQARRLRHLTHMNEGKLNPRGVWLMVLALAACEREARS